MKNVIIYSVKVILLFDVGRKEYLYNSMADLLEDFQFDYGFRNYFLMANEVKILRGYFL